MGISSAGLGQTWGDEIEFDYSLRLDAETPPTEGSGID